MKIRSGFVSNSSSASYVIKINMELEDFINEIYNEFDYTFFDIKKIYDQEESLYKEYDKSLSEEKNQRNKSIFLYNKDRLKELKTKLETIQKFKSLHDYDNEEGKFVGNRVNIITWILENIYFIKISTQFNNVNLNCSTSMHNSYSDVPNIIKDIITYFNFARPEIKITYKKEED